MQTQEALRNPLFLGRFSQGCVEILDKQKHKKV